MLVYVKLTRYIIIIVSVLVLKLKASPIYMYNVPKCTMCYCNHLAFYLKTHNLHNKYMYHTIQLTSI